MVREFGYREGIAAFQILCFSVFFLCAVFMARTRKSGWFFVGGISIIRLVGASCLLVTLKDDSRKAWAAVYVCESLGVLMLTFLLLGMLERANQLVPLLSRWFFGAPVIFSWLGIGFTFADFAEAAKKGTAYDGLNPYGIIGLVMFLAVFLVTAALAAFFFLRRAAFTERDQPGERRQVDCVAACVPLLAVRVAYPMAGRLSPPGYETFNPVRGGNPTLYLLMVALTEIAVVGLSTAAILWYGRDWRQYEKAPRESVDEQLQSLEPTGAARQA